MAATASSSKTKAQAVSGAMIDDEAEESGSDASSSADSDEDLEAITPKKSRVNEAATSVVKPGKSLPKYTPPHGMAEVKISTAFVNSPFEWNALASKSGVEIWAIRAPKDLKAARLSSMNVSVPKHGAISGSLKTKSQSYTLSSAGSSKHTHAVVDAEGRQPTAGPGLVDAMAMDVDGHAPSELRVEGGEEMEGGMRLLLPKVSQAGKLYVAPVPITRHLLLTPEVTATSEVSSETQPLPSFLSTSAPETTETPSSIHPEAALPSKRAQPTHLMKFRNHAYGFSTPGPSAGVEQASAAAPLVKEKRRKAESPVKKKAKKVKV